MSDWSVSREQIFTQPEREPEPYRAQTSAGAAPHHVGPTSAYGRSAGPTVGEPRLDRLRDLNLARTDAGSSSRSVAAAGKVQRPETCHLVKSDLRPGDILLLIDEPESKSMTARVVTAGQALERMSLLRHNKGESNLVHSMLWTKAQGNPGNSEPQGKGEPEIAETRGGKRLCAQNTALRKGLYRVYRPTDKNAGDWAAQISMVWANDRGAIPYSKSDAALSVFRTSTLGSKAKERADRYTAEAFDSSPAWGAEGSFCSAFILAAYQAAARQTGKSLSGALEVDAQSTSVRTLDHFLKRDPGQFTLLGHIRIRPEDVLYQD